MKSNESKINNCGFHRTWFRRMQKIQRRFYCEETFTLQIDQLLVRMLS